MNYVAGETTDVLCLINLDALSTLVCLCGKQKMYSLIMMARFSLRPPTRAASTWTTSLAPAWRNCLKRMRFWQHSPGAILMGAMPSRICLGGRLAPEISANVGRKSTVIRGVVVVEAGRVCPGQRTIIGTRMPPS